MLPRDIFQNHRHIGLDLDETLAESVMHGLAEFHSAGKMLFLRTLEDIKHFDWMLFPEVDVTHEEYLVFWRNHHLTDTLPVKDAIDGVYQLFLQQKSISVITARNEHDHKIDTERWLGKYFPEIHPSNIHFANHTASMNRRKSEICREIGVSLMIEDGLHNAKDLVENNIACILFEKPWNRDIEFEHPLLYRIKCWQEIIDNLAGNV